MKCKHKFIHCESEIKRKTVAGLTIKKVILMTFYCEKCLSIRQREV